MSWHRAYQNAMEDAGHSEQAERDYEALTKQEPDNKDLLYLAGRANRNLDQALRPLKLKPAQKLDLVRFLESLTSGDLARVAGQ